MLERVLVCLLAGGHMLIEGVPGLAKTLTIKTAAQRARRHVPAHPVHARPRACRPRRHAHLPPHHGHVRHRARAGLHELPARRRDQPRARQGAVGPARGHAGADRSRSAARPTRSSGPSSSWRRRTRSSPRAPIRCPRRRSTASCSRCWWTTPPSRMSTPSPSARSPRPVEVRRVIELERLLALQDAVRNVYVDPAVDALRRPTRIRHARPRAATASASSPRTSPSASAPAVPSACCTPRARWPCCADATTCCPPTSTSSRPTRCVTASCSRTARWPRASAPRPSSPRAGQGPDAAGRARERGRVSEVALALVPPTPARPGPGPVPETALRALDLTVRRRIENVLAGDHRAASLGVAMELAQVRPYQPGDDVRLIDWNATARMVEPHVRLHVAERALTTWLDVRRLALDGLRHGAAPQGRRRRGCRPGGRPRRQPPRQPPRPAHLRPQRPALRAAPPGPRSAWSACCCSCARSTARDARAARSRPTT